MHIYIYIFFFFLNQAIIQEAMLCKYLELRDYHISQEHLEIEINLLYKF